MKIEAAHRLKATKEVEDRTLKTLLGVDGDLLKLTDDEALYSIHENAEQALKAIKSKLGKPKEGRKGDTLMYVWENVPELGIILYVPAKGKPTIEMYET